MAIKRSPRLGNLSDPRVRAALYYARKRRLKRLSGDGGGSAPPPGEFDEAFMTSVKAGAVMNDGINYTASHQITSVKVGAVLRET